MAQPARASGSARVLISGASGLIGTELVRQLREDGHVVSTLVRRQPQTPDEHNWAPGAGLLDTRLIDDTDAVINLSGAPLQRLPWTRAYKKEIVQSRVNATRTLVHAMNLADRPPAVFLSASAVGIYGDRPGERLDESSSPGIGFLADVVTAWEEAAGLAPVTTRLVLFRTGLVIARAGALAQLAALTKFGLGPGIGTGGDVWPWISLYDEAAAIRHALTSSFSGVVNLVGPTPATSDRITR
ncbi:MAG: NAD-dependent epimerase/dehydratase family protein, partial [Terrimesophilobacter sp.]